MICFPSRCPGSGGDVKGEDGGSQSNRRTEEKRGFLETLREISTITLVWQPLDQITNEIYGSLIKNHSKQTKHFSGQTKYD